MDLISVIQSNSRDIERESPVARMVHQLHRNWLRQNKGANKGKEFLLSASFHQEFLPYLREAVKASDISGMSCKKAAVVNISTSLGSLHLVKETLATFGATALPYRASKVSGR